MCSNHFLRSVKSLSHWESSFSNDLVQIVFLLVQISLTPLNPYFSRMTSPECTDQILSFCLPVLAIKRFASMWIEWTLYGISPSINCFNQSSTSSKKECFTYSEEKPWLHHWASHPVKNKRRQGLHLVRDKSDPSRLICQTDTFDGTWLVDKKLTWSSLSHLKCSVWSDQ